MKLQLTKHHTPPISGIPDDSRKNQVTSRPCRGKLAGLALAMALTGSAHAQTPLHYDGAALLLNQIIDLQDEGIFADANNISINRYGGKWNSNTDPSFVQWATAENNLLPMNNTKCSSFVTHLFKNLYGWNWRNFTFFDPVKNSDHSTASPEAYQYVALIKQGKGFEQVTTLDSAETGDILSWWVVGSSSSDHTMIISSIDWDSAKPYPLASLEPSATMPQGMVACYLKRGGLRLRACCQAVNSRWGSERKHHAGVGFGAAAVLKAPAEVEAGGAGFTEAETEADADAGEGA